MRPREHLSDFSNTRPRIIGMVIGLTVSTTEVLNENSDYVLARCSGNDLIN